MPDPGDRPLDCSSSAHSFDPASGAVEDQVRSIMEKYVRPLVQADGGDVEVVEVAEDRQVTIRLTGACRGCPGRPYTVDRIVELTLRHHVHDAIRVRAC